MMFIGGREFINWVALCGQPVGATETTSYFMLYIICLLTISISEFMLFI